MHAKYSLFFSPPLKATYIPLLLASCNRGTRKDRLGFKLNVFGQLFSCVCVCVRVCVSIRAGGRPLLFLWALNVYTYSDTFL